MSKVMKKVLLIVMLFLLTISIAFAQNNIYQQDSLHLELNVDGKFKLVSEGAGARVSEASAEIYLFPQDNFRQETLEIEHLGEVKDNHIFFEWNNPGLGTKEFGYSAIIRTMFVKE